MLKFGGNCPSSNWDMTQNVNLQGYDFESQGHLWSQQFFAKLSAPYPWAYMWSFTEIPLAVSQENLCTILLKSGQEKMKKKKKKKKKKKQEP